MNSLMSRRTLLQAAGLGAAALVLPRAAMAVEPGQALPITTVPGAVGQAAVPARPAPPTSTSGPPGAALAGSPSRG